MIITYFLKGLAAYKAGLKEGDELVSVNKQDVSSLSHEDLVSMIKQVRESFDSE